MFSDRYGLTKAVIDGWKTMTRRMFTMTLHERSEDGEIHNVEPDYVLFDKNEWRAIYKGAMFIVPKANRPKYKIEEVVAVAQSYKDACVGTDMKVFVPHLGANIPVIYTAGFDNKMYVQADLMPHQIQITDVRVERLQDISDEDCLKEGICYLPEIRKYYFERADKEQGFYFNSPREAFAALIDKVSGAGTWERNPFVVVYGFELVK